VQFLKREMLAEAFQIEAPAALLSSGDGEIDPYQFTQSLFHAGQEQGLRLYHHTAVEAIRESPARVKLATSQGIVTARAAILCTGYAASEFLGTTPGELSTTYAVASEPGAAKTGWPSGCLLWETARPYFYARQSADHRLIIGGADTSGAFDHRNDGRLLEKMRSLTARLQRMFPDIVFEPAFVWAGTFAETKDGLPYIGKLPGRENLYAALGYGGNGITFGMIAAQLLTDLFLGQPNVDQAVFAFGR
jgi:glycine/D-amino acid oxidase-like deaminating enzyme